MARPRWQKGTLLTVKTAQGNKWRGRWLKYVVIDGKEVAKPQKRFLGLCSQMTKTEAKLELLRLIEADNTPAQLVQQPSTVDARQNTRLTFAELSDRYERMYQGGWAPKTRGTNASFLKKFKEAFGSRFADEITKEDLQLWLNNQADQSQNARSKSYVKQAITHLRKMYSDAVEEKLLAHDPAKKLKVPRTKKSDESYLDLQECYRLLSACSDRDHLILRIFLVCGLRPGENFALRVNDVEPGRLRIDETIYEGRFKNYAKTEESIGYVAMSPALEAEVRNWIAKRKIEDCPNELLFLSTRGKPIHAGNYLDRDLARIGKRAKISKLNHQMLRRTTATHFQKHGTVKEAQGHLRHTDPETTLRWYQKVIPEALKASVNSWDSALCPVSGSGKPQ